MKSKSLLHKKNLHFIRIDGNDLYTFEYGVLLCLINLRMMENVTKKRLQALMFDVVRAGRFGSESDQIGTKWDKCESF